MSEKHFTISWKLFSKKEKKNECVPTTGRQKLTCYLNIRKIATTVLAGAFGILHDHICILTDLCSWCESPVHFASLDTCVA